MNTEEHYTWSIIITVYYTPPLQMGKSVQANLSRGLQSLTGYCQVGAAREVASAVVAVPDSVSDTVGVGVGVTTGTDQIQQTVRCQRLFHYLVQCDVQVEDALERSLSNGLGGASKIDHFPHPPSM